MIKTLNWHQEGCRQRPDRPDRFPSIGDHIHITLTFEYTWATPKHAVIGGSKKSKDWY